MVVDSAAGEGEPSGVGANEGEESPSASQESTDMPASIIEAKVHKAKVAAKTEASSPLKHLGRGERTRERETKSVALSGRYPKQAASGLEAVRSVAHSRIDEDEEAERLSDRSALSDREKPHVIIAFQLVG